MRASLQFVIDWMKSIDDWHEFKFSDRQYQTVSQEFQDFGEPVLMEALELIKKMPSKPSPAKMMNLCKEVQIRHISDRQLDMPDEDPSTWMTSREYARSQGFDSLKDLIKHKIKEDQINSDTKIEGYTASTSLDPSLEKQIDIWDSLGEEE